MKSGTGDGKQAEKGLFEDFARGDREAFSEIMKKYRNKALNFAYRYLGDFSEAEDAAQDCFVKIYLNRRRFDTDRDFEPWFYRILANVCRDRIRKKSRFSDFIERFTQEKKSQPEVSAVELKADSTLFAKALQKLSPAKREVIALRYSQDLSYEEIGRALDISPGTVMSRLHRAKKDLEKILKTMGLEL